MRRAEGSHRRSRRRSWRTRLFPLLGVGLLLTAACQATPSPSSSPGTSFAPFISTSYPNGAAADCAYGGELAQIKAVDPLTVEFWLCYPDPAFLAKIAMSNNAIQDSGWMARYGPTAELAVKANGTGPYMVTDGTPSAGDHLSLGRFAGYWGDGARAAAVTVEWKSDAAARVRALELGQVDGIDDPSPADYASIDRDSTLQLKLRELLNTTYIGMTSDFAPFDNVRIRRALAMGVDRQRIIDNALPPGSSLARFFTPCSIEFGCAGDPWYDLDQHAALALLATPSVPGPLTTHIYYRDEVGCTLADPGLVAQELQTQLEALGIRADLRALPSLTFADKLSAGLLDGLYVLDWCAEFPDITNFLDQHLNNPGSRQLGTIAPSITDALTAAAQMAGPTARRAAYTAANNAIRAAVPMIPIAHGGSATAWKADVMGAVASPVDAESFAAMDPGGRATLTWMQGGPPGSFYCPLDAAGDSVRLCENVFEQLYAFQPGTAVAAPGLATTCDPNAELTVWTCHLRSGVTFHDGASLDANDVLQSFAAQWDYQHPTHAPRRGLFTGWAGEFGPLLNMPPPAP